MTKEEEKYINELVEKFNKMTYEEQQEELKNLYRTCEIAYVEVVERYSKAVKKLRKIQQELKEIEYK